MPGDWTPEQFIVLEAWIKGIVFAKRYYAEPEAQEAEKLTRAKAYDALVGRGDHLEGAVSDA